MSDLGTIYLKDDRKRMKIGQTKNFVRRSYTYDTHNPDYRNIIVAKVPLKDMDAIEEYLKERLSEFWLVGKEWFCRSQKVGETVREVLEWDCNIKVDEYWGDGLSLDDVLESIGHQERTLERFGVCGQDYQVGKYGSNEDVYLALVSIELHHKWRDRKMEAAQ